MKIVTPEIGLTMLQMVAKGMTAIKVAEELGISKHNMASKICRAWRKEFRRHYEANSEKICKRGAFTALRDSPPIFASSHTHLQTNQK
jgi:hypothetical protein